MTPPRRPPRRRKDPHVPTEIHLRVVTDESESSGYDPMGSRELSGYDPNVQPVSLPQTETEGSPGAPIGAGFLGVLALILLFVWLPLGLAVGLIALLLLSVHVERS